MNRTVKVQIGWPEEAGPSPNKNQSVNHEWYSVLLLEDGVPAACFQMDGLGPLSLLAMAWLQGSLDDKIQELVEELKHRTCPACGSLKSFPHAKI